jgi:type II secretory pathway pseudopilin PulG
MGRCFQKEEGFTFISVLMIVVIMGLMLGSTGQYWKTVMKREKELELLFRGAQYRDAIQRWNKPRPGQHIVTPLRDLQHLLKDPRSVGTVRYLRRLYKDPVADKDWVVITDPVRGIIGVASSSSEKPLKTGGFPEELKEFEGKEKYSDWQFVYRFQGQTARQPGVIR